MSSNEWSLLDGEVIYSARMIILELLPIPIADVLVTGNTLRCHFARHAKKWVRDLVKRLYESTHSASVIRTRIDVKYSKTVYKIR